VAYRETGATYGRTYGGTFRESLPSGDRSTCYYDRSTCNYYGGNHNRSSCNYNRGNYNRSTCYNYGSYNYASSYYH